MDFKQLEKQYRDELLQNVIPFWLEKSQDKECGGYFTCLDREGNVFDTDKFIWLQAREVWLFAMLYNRVEKRQEWLDCAIQGAEFLKKYGHPHEMVIVAAWARPAHAIRMAPASSLGVKLRVMIVSACRGENVEDDHTCEMFNFVENPGGALVSA